MKHPAQKLYDEILQRSLVLLYCLFTYIHKKIVLKM